MTEDPIFKERFGLTTTIRYVPKVIVEPKWQKSFTHAWNHFLKKHKQGPPTIRSNRFDSLLRRVERLEDDLAYTKRIAIRYINASVGFGVFAKVTIPPYSILNQYAGILKPDRLISTSNDSTFMFSDFSKFSIDAQTTGNWCRFMNHGPEGDKLTNVIAWEHYTQWGPRIIFTAGKEGIREGTQLLYSYGDSYWEENAFKLF